MYSVVFLQLAPAWKYRFRTFLFTEYPIICKKYILKKVLKMTVLFGVMLYVIFLENTQIKIRLAYLNRVVVSCQRKIDVRCSMS